MSFLSSIKLQYSRTIVKCLRSLKLLKKTLFQKRRWSCDFPPRKTRVAQKHRAISRQEKMAFSTPVGLSWHSPPPPRDCADGRAYGLTHGRSREYYVTTKISRLDRLRQVSKTADWFKDITSKASRNCY